MADFAPRHTDTDDSDDVRTVGELTRDIKRVLEGGFSQVWVEGELFTFKRHSSGHLYFTLKDSGAQLSAVMFRGSAARLNFAPSEGMRVQCRGRISVYEPQGKYQIVCDGMRVAGEGALLAALERLKKKLAAEGLFEPGRRKPLPALPRRIGIVTSPTGAAVRDMLRTLHDRYPVPVLLYPAAVQGVAAAREIAEGIGALDAVSDVDVIIIGRGGGSLEDLWAFNEELVVRAVAECRTPIVSAVGHEVDFLLSDFAADARAATPTGAAEMVVPRWVDLKAAVDDTHGRLVRSIRRRIETHRLQLQAAQSRLVHPQRLVEQRALRLDDATRRLERAMSQRLQVARRRHERASDRLASFHPRRVLREDRRTLVGLQRRLAPAMLAHLERARQRLQTREHQLRALSPEQVLQRGYAIVRVHPDGRVVRAHRDVKRGDTVEIRLAAGSLTARVDTRHAASRAPRPASGPALAHKAASAPAVQPSLFDAPDAPDDTSSE